MWLKSATHVRVSFLHRDVSRVLTSMGHEHYIEHLTEDRLFSMDISLASATPHPGLLPCILQSTNFMELETLKLGSYIIPEFLCHMNALTKSMWV